MNTDTTPQDMTLPQLLDAFPLNCNELARRAGINPSLMRQYRCRPNHPISESRKAEIEATVHRIAREMLRTHIV